MLIRLNRNDVIRFRSSSLAQRRIIELRACYVVRQRASERVDFVNYDVISQCTSNQVTTSMQSSIRKMFSLKEVDNVCVCVIKNTCKAYFMSL